MKGRCCYQRGRHFSGARMLQKLKLGRAWKDSAPVILESDCARVVRAIQSRMDKSELSFLVAEAIEETQGQRLRAWFP
nr:unnamed protein product [Digitaria exilis]